MYKIFADETLIYDSTLEDYKIGQGTVTLELDKAGSFVFSLYPDHFYYDRFVSLRTVVTVYKANRIVFRGRVIDETTNYQNNKVLTCEGELGFLQDSIVRPYNFSGTPAQLFRQFINSHNGQVGEFKRFKVGTVTVTDANNYIARENAGYESTMSNLTSRLLEDATGGHFYITHGDDGRDPVPTIHYLADFTKVASQAIEFGVNLRNYAKAVKAQDVATAIIPLGATVDDGNSDTEDPKLTIASVNGGRDYVYSAKGVALYDWIFRTVDWDDVTDPAHLKARAEAYVAEVVNKAITIDLTAVDLHFLDRSIESFNVCEYVRVTSQPHNFEDVLLCNRQVLNLLNPANDTMTLGHTFKTFTEMSARNASSMSSIQSWSGRMGKVMQTSKKNTAAIVQLANAAENIITRLDALYATGYITLTVTVGGAAADMLTSTGTLTVNGQRLTADSSTIAAAAGDVQLVYTLAMDIEEPRAVTANGVAMGTVSKAGQTITTTLSDVIDGGSIVVMFDAV